MKRLTAKDLDQDLLDLYDYYVHGKSASASFSTAPAVCRWRCHRRRSVQHAQADYAMAEQVSFNNPEHHPDLRNLRFAERNGTVRGYLVKPAKAEGKLTRCSGDPRKSGLNPYIKDVARRVAKADSWRWPPTA